MASSSKTTALQQAFTQDDSKSYFQVMHKRGQRCVKHERLINPLTTFDKIDGKTVQFQIQKIGHMVNSIVLEYDFNFTAAGFTALANTGVKKLSVQTIPTTSATFTEGGFGVNSVPPITAGMIREWVAIGDDATANSRRTDRLVSAQFGPGGFLSNYTYQTFAVALQATNIADGSIGVGNPAAGTQATAQAVVFINAPGAGLFNGVQGQTPGAIAANGAVTFGQLSTWLADTTTLDISNLTTGAAFFPPILNNQFVSVPLMTNSGNGTFELVDLPGMRGFDLIEFDYGGDNIIRITDDEVRMDYHLFKTDEEKLCARKLATNYSIDWIPNDASKTLDFAGGLGVSILQNGDGPQGGASSYSRGMDFRYVRETDIGHATVSTGSIGPGGTGSLTQLAGAFSTMLGGVTGLTPTQNLTLTWRVKIPWTHDMSSDRNLPVALLDNTVLCKIRFRQAYQLLYSVSGTVYPLLASIGTVAYNASPFVAGGQSILGVHTAAAGNTPYANNVVSTTTIAGTSSIFGNGNLFLNNPRLRVEYRDQPGPLINALGREPTITYPLSHVINERYITGNTGFAGMTSIDIPLNSLRGIGHTVCVMLRDQSSLNGKVNLHGNTCTTNAAQSAVASAPEPVGVFNPNIFRGYTQDFLASTLPQQGIPLVPYSLTSTNIAGPASAGSGLAPPTINTLLYGFTASDVLLYDYDFLAMSSVETININTPNQANVVAVPGGQMYVSSWYMEANGERITGKIALNAEYMLTQYKASYFPAHTELIRSFAGQVQRGSVNPFGYNLFTYTWGLDGAREAVGTGNVNFDALSSVKLHLDFKSGPGVDATTNMLPTANVAVLQTGGAPGFSMMTSTFQANTLGTIQPNAAALAMSTPGSWVPQAKEPIVVDVYLFTANFTTIEGGNWFRQLA